MEVIGKKPILGNPADLMEEEVGEILCHTIRIGEYVVTKPNEGMPIPVSFSNTGFYFSLPDSKNCKSNIQVFGTKIHAQFAFISHTFLNILCCKP